MSCNQRSKESRSGGAYALSGDNVGAHARLLIPSLSQAKLSNPVAKLQLWSCEVCLASSAMEGYPVMQVLEYRVPRPPDSLPLHSGTYKRRPCHG